MGNSTEKTAVQQVKLADELNYAIAWFAEHHFSNYCLCPSPLTMATHMSAHTSRIKLGPAVIGSIDAFGPAAPDARR